MNMHNTTAPLLSQQSSTSRLEFHNKQYYVYAVKFNRDLKSKKDTSSLILHTFCILSVKPLYTPEFVIDRRDNNETTATLIPFCSVVMLDSEISRVIEFHNFFVYALAHEKQWEFNLSDLRYNSEEMLVLPVLQRLDVLDTQVPTYYESHRDLHTGTVQNPIQFSQLAEMIKLDYSYIQPFGSDLNTLIKEELDKYRAEYPGGINQIRNIFRKYRTRVSLNQVIENDPDLQRAIEVAEEVSKLFSSVAITTYNNTPYNIEAVDFYTRITDTMTKETTVSSFYEYYTSKKIVIQDIDQPLIRASFAHEKVSEKIAEWEKDGVSPVKMYLTNVYEKLPPKDEFEQLSKTDKVPKESKSSSIFIVPELCCFSHLSESISTYARFVTKILSYLKAMLTHYQKLESLEDRIGYKFQNKLLLRQALTHKSFCSENEAAMTHNERLEFLGDSVLEIIVSHYLFEKFKVANEGLLTRYRTSMVKNKYLENIGNKLGIMDYLLYPALQHQVIMDSRKIAADTLEAIVGAIFLDGGLIAAKEFCESTIMKEIMFETAKSDNENFEFHSFEIPFIYQVKLDSAQQELISDFESKIGITFNNPYLILQALTHNSWKSRENFEFKDPRYVFNYERLEFLGDCVLKFVVGSYLFLNYPNADERKMTLSRHNTVDNDVSLASAGDHLNFAKYIRHDIPYGLIKPGGPTYKGIISDVFEAVLGAIYLDQGGLYLIDSTGNDREYDVYGAFVHQHLIELKKDCVNPDVVQMPFKNSLQEIVQLFSGRTPVYRDEEIIVREGSYYYNIAVYVNNTKLAIGEGDSRREAENNAARKGYELCRRICSDQVAQYNATKTEDAQESVNIGIMRDFEALVVKYSKDLSYLFATSLENHKRQELENINLFFELRESEEETEFDAEEEQVLKGLLHRKHQSTSESSSTTSPSDNKRQREWKDDKAHSPLKKPKLD